MLISSSVCGVCLLNCSSGDGSRDSAGEPSTLTGGAGDASQQISDGQAGAAQPSSGGAAAGSGSAAAVAGSGGTGGSSAVDAAPVAGGGVTSPDSAPSGLSDDPDTTGSGTSTERYAEDNVTRDGQNYYLMANGWGDGFETHSITWQGTAFTINEMSGTGSAQGSPASYPTVFCGAYSTKSSNECGLPAAVDSLTSLRTGWRWAPGGNNGEYNAAYDIWFSNGGDFRTGYIMVWLRDPDGPRPAGETVELGVTVPNVPSTWDIWTGEALGVPIINYVRPEGSDLYEIEFDVLDFIRDARSRGIDIPGTQILSVAVGFEIWNGPITNLQSLDFYVDAQ